MTQELVQPDLDFEGRVAVFGVEGKVSGVDEGDGFGGGGGGEDVA